MEGGIEAGALVKTTRSLWPTRTRYDCYIRLAVKLFAAGTTYFLKQVACSICDDRLWQVREEKIVENHRIILTFL